MSKLLKKKLSALREITSFMEELLWLIIKSNDSKIASFLRQKKYTTKCYIDTNVTIKNKRNFIAGSRTSLYHSCYILNNYGNFVIGSNSHLGAFCYVNCYYGKIIIGNNVAIGPGTKIISYSNHYEIGKQVTDSKITANIFISDNVLIGANCTILPGTLIHSNVVIGAGAVVKGEIDGNSIYAGVPCKKIKKFWYEEFKSSN